MFPYDVLTCTLHVYKATVQPVASCSLFLDVQDNDNKNSLYGHILCKYDRIIEYK